MVVRIEGAVGGTGHSGGSGQPKKGVTNGFVNGAGAVNGFRLSYQQRKLRVEDVTLTKKLVVVILLVALIIALPYALVYTFPKAAVNIDGYFMDWLKVQKYHDVPDSANPGHLHLRIRDEVRWQWDILLPRDARSALLG